MLPTAPSLEMLFDGVHWKLLEDMCWTDRAGRVWWARAGLITDLTSIPRYLWSLVGSPGTGLYRMAAILHDAAYSNTLVSKTDADFMLRECSIACGTPVWLADLIFEGVHVGGASAYVDDQKIAAAKQGALTPAGA